MIEGDGPRLRFAPHQGPGRLITIDGLDGSGKTTVVELVRGHLAGRGVPVVTTRFPTTEMRRSWYFEVLRNQGRTDLVDPVAFEVEYMVDRIQHCRTVVEPALGRGRTVITDRYAFSSIGTLLLRLPELRRVVLDAIFVESWFTDLCRHLVQPDLSFVLHTAPAIGAGRLRSRPDEDDVGFTPREYQELQELLLRLARTNRMIPIDTGGSPQAALAACLPHLERLGLPDRNGEHA